MNARLAACGVPGTAQHRRAYREMLLTTPALAEGISGLKPLAGPIEETITEGLDGLRERLSEYARGGARFAKWRAVFLIGGQRPTWRALRANAHALARFAAVCQDAGVVPVVEPEVLMDGSHGLDLCASVTSAVLLAVFSELREFDVMLEAIILKPNMILPGASCAEIVAPEQVAARTVREFEIVVPEEVAGLAFLSGGQSPDAATANLAALQRVNPPWPVTFSFGRALADPALMAWRGEPGRARDGQQALANRVACNLAALRGAYRSVEAERAGTLTVTVVPM